MHDLLEFAIDLAFESGRIQRRHFQKEFAIHHKGEINLVTDVDLECEARIIERIRAHLPDDDIVSEEKVNTYEPNRNRWIIDPLDGTTNYAHGYPFFCTSIAYEVEGQVALGVVYNPIFDELFFARKGGGAFLNGDRLSVSRTTELKRALLSTGFPYDVTTNPRNNLDHWAAFIMRARALRRDGSAALNLSYVAAGRFDGYWEMKLNAWDMAAGVLMVREAGGGVTSLSGAPFSIYGGDVLATNGPIHEPMTAVLKEGS